MSLATDVDYGPFRVDGCRSCGALIIWAVTANGKDQPVDAEASSDGNIALDERGPDRRPLARVLSVVARFGRRDLRKPHHATCPQGAAWRTRKVRTTP